MYLSSYIIDDKLFFFWYGRHRNARDPVIAVTSASASGCISSARMKGLTTDIVCYSTNMSAVSNLPYGCA